MEHTHTESSVKVYFSKDYAKFNFIKGNRMLIAHKVEKLMADIKSGNDLLKYNPILVNEGMDIIDGQHRFYVSKKLGRPVFYIITQNVNLYGIAKLNTNVTKWKNGDYINCYIEQGIEDYRILEAFVKEYPFFSHTAAVGLLYSGVVYGGGRHLEIFRDGTFRVMYLDKATDLARVLIRFKKFEALHDREFIRAIAELKDGGLCDFDRLELLFNQRKDAFTRGNKKHYLSQLETIYNTKLKSRVAIY